MQAKLTKNEFNKLYILQFVFLIHEKSRGIEFFSNSFIMPPGLMRDKTGDLSNEVYFSNPTVYLK